MKKKMLCLALAMVLLVSIVPGTASAKERDEIKVYFSEFCFTIPNYNPEEVQIRYSKEENAEVATITDVKTGLVKETVSVIPQVTSVGVVTPYILTRTSTFGDTQIKLSIHVEMYSYGSFRQINSIQGTYLGIVTSVTSNSIESYTASAWPQNNTLPTIVVYYAYSGTLVAVKSSSFSIGVSPEDYGYSYSYTSGSTKYYRLPFSATGSISLY